MMRKDKSVHRPRLCRWRSRLFSVAAATGLAFGLPPAHGTTTTIDVASFGVEANTGMDATAGVLKAIAFAQSRPDATLVFRRGRYDFWPHNAAIRRYFISNHDDVPHRAVAFPLEGFRNFTVDGKGSEFIFHEAILPFSVVHSTGITLRNFSLDYATPHTIQGKIVRVGVDSVDLQIGEDSSYAIDNGHLAILGEQSKQIAKFSVEFDPQRKGMAWNSEDDWQFSSTASVTQLSPGVVRVKGLRKLPNLGDILVLWSSDRPNPVIFASESRRVTVKDVTVHSGQGMGFLAQKSEDIHLDGFNVTLREATSRITTTIADAVHFSNCKGKVVVENGLFENMLDDGINVHGSYLRVKSHPSPERILLEFGHYQSFGFAFAAPGEHVQFVDPKTLLPYASAIVLSVDRVDDKQVALSFDHALPDCISVNDGVENADWRPTVVYRHNHVRNNRARGALFSTPAGVVVEDNFFDHLAGPAILMTADCQGWFESAPSNDVIIRHNQFVDPLIAKYGDAPILIEPSWDPGGSNPAFSVRSIHIENNYFRIFNSTLLRAVSIDGLSFRNNVVEKDSDYPPNLKAGSPAFSLVHARCIDIGKNKLPWALSNSNIDKQDTQAVSIQGLLAQPLKACSR